MGDEVLVWLFNISNRVSSSICMISHMEVNLGK